MSPERSHGNDDKGEGLLGYVLLVAVIVIVLVAALRGGILPRTGLTAPLADFASAIEGVVAGLSGLSKQVVRPFLLRFRFP